MSALKKLEEDVVQCRACPLAGGRTNAVPGEGSDKADLVFVGEAPGASEDRQGRPFVGSAGKFLDELLHSIGLNRNQVYIANIIKCRPPGNRDPQPDEIAACKPWLDRQIEIIKPRMIVTLGRFSMSLFIPGKAISKCHGIPVSRDGVTFYPMYHPAAALHQNNLRQVIMADMLRIPILLEEIKAGDDAQSIQEETTIQQLKLF